jgi:hypothetical protein
MTTKVAISLPDGIAAAVEQARHRRGETRSEFFRQAAAVRLGIAGAAPRPRTTTWSALRAVLLGGPQPDAAFAADIAALRDAQPPLPESPWGR